MNSIKIIGRRLTRIASYLIVFSILLISVACTQKTTMTTTNDAYDYPVEPGTEGWKAFTTMDEMLEACQVPEKTLSRMSTAGLVETVLNFPLLSVFTAYNRMQDGLDMLTSRFNGLKELFNRKDAGTELLGKYATMEPLPMDNERTDLQRVNYYYSFVDIEMLLAQESIIDQLTPAQCQELSGEAARKSQIIRNDPNLYSTFYGEANSLLMERLAERMSR